MCSAQNDAKLQPRRSDVSVRDDLNLYRNSKLDESEKSRNNEDRIAAKHSTLYRIYPESRKLAPRNEMSVRNDRNL